MQKYKSMSHDIRRVQIAEKLKSSQINKILNTVGQEIQQNVDDPYGYLLRKNYSKQELKSVPKMGPTRSQKVTMSISELWSEKMKKRVDKVLKELKGKHQQQILNLSQMQSISNRNDDEFKYQINMNASKMMEQFGLKTLMPKKKSQKFLKITISTKHCQNEELRSRVLSDFDQQQTKTPPKRYYNNSETTSTSTKKYCLTNFRKYSVNNNQISQGIMNCLGDCEEAIQSTKNLHRALNKPTKNRHQIYLEKQQREQLKELLLLQINQKKKTELDNQEKQ